MLKEVEAQAKERGWVVVSETASTGLADRLVTEGLPWIAQQLDSPAHARRVSGVSLPMSLGAGLPSTVNDLLSDDVLTLLRRADRHNLAAVAAADVADALRQPIEATSRQIEDDALAEAADGTGGYPFLIQLIGYWIWRIRDAAAEIDLAQVREGSSPPAAAWAPSSTSQRSSTCRKSTGLSSRPWQ